MSDPLIFPAFDPVALQLGPLAIRWYGLAYIAALLGGWLIMRRLLPRSTAAAPADAADDFLTWATVGVILGGRLGYVLFYKPAYYLSQPLEIVQVWHGGMSFHGGLLGVVLATILFTRRRGIPLLGFADVLAVVAPLGLLFGRTANFINGELFGRVTDVPWGMVFPHGGPLSRHPSQLYEAGLEGLVLFLILAGLWNIRQVRERPGVLTGLFISGYGLARFAVEFYREPDAFLGTLPIGLTMGQTLSLPMVLGGLALAGWAAGKARGGAKAPPRDAHSLSDNR
jgi:phosphatidylglycerol:prolipoprotein diacylglycerol transferase